MGSKDCIHTVVDRQRALKSEKDINKSFWPIWDVWEYWGWFHLNNYKINYQPFVGDFVNFVYDYFNVQGPGFFYNR